MTNQDCAKIGNTLLRGELSALETYDQAIDKYPAAKETSTLQAIRQEHIQNAETLKGLIQETGAAPTEGPGSWGGFARSVESGSQMLGRKAALGALLQGEKQGKRDYEEALRKKSLPEDWRETIRDHLLSRQCRHINELENLMH